MSKVKFNIKNGWHYFFFIGKIKYMHGRMASKEQAENLRRIYNH